MCTGVSVHNTQWPAALSRRGSDSESESPLSEAAPPDPKRQTPRPALQVPVPTHAAVAVAHTETRRQVVPGPSLPKSRADSESLNGPVTAAAPGPSNLPPSEVPVPH